MASAKTAVIEYLFFTLKAYAPGHILANPIVTFGDINAAISALHAKGDRRLKLNANRANFWKDITRHDPNRVWPASVLGAGYTGADAIGLGAGASFMFLALPVGQSVAFIDPLSPSQKALSAPVALESVSMPIATKALGRKDENWLAQVGVRLRVIESHLALRSGLAVAEVTFLQTGVKLGRGEVDAAYSVVDTAGETWLVALEAKGRRERIHVPQVQRAAGGLLRAAHARHQDVAGVIPMAIKVMGPSLLHVVEFDYDTGKGSLGAVVADSIIELKPFVLGIE